MTSIKSLKEGSTVKLTRLTKESRETRPPARFSEVSLGKKLSDSGIGRPATLAPIISVIQERGYAKRKGTQLYPTPLGFAIARVLTAKFPEFTDYGYTAAMEESLESIEEGKQSRVKFLTDFWKGKQGFEALLAQLRKDVDYEEIAKLCTIDLHNGYEIVVNRFGSFLQDPTAKPNEKGYLPSVKLDEEVDLWEYKEAEVCRELLAKAQTHEGPRKLGALTAGAYKDWIVFAKTGKFGDYLQAVHPQQLEAEAAGKKPSAKTPKPVNHKLPEGLELATVELTAVKSLFSDVKLPRTLSPNFFAGEGKKGAYLGHKASAKARKAVFVSLPETLDPRTMTLADAKRLWEEHEAKKTDSGRKPNAGKK